MHSLVMGKSTASQEVNDCSVEGDITDASFDRLCPAVFAVPWTCVRCRDVSARAMPEPPAHPTLQMTLTYIPSTDSALR